MMCCDTHVDTFLVVLSLAVGGQVLGPGTLAMPRAWGSASVSNNGHLQSAWLEVIVCWLEPTLYVHVGVGASSPSPVLQSWSNSEVSLCRVALWGLTEAALSQAHCLMLSLPLMASVMALVTPASCCSQPCCSHIQEAQQLALNSRR